jgi:MFS family permease
MVLGSVLIAALGNRVRLVLFYFLSIFASALALAATGLSPTFVVALGALAMAGIANGIDDVTANTILQKQVPDAFLGRVFAVRFLGFSAGEVLAYLVGGAIVDSSGPRFTYLFAGTATAVVGLLILLLVATAFAKRTQSS